MLPIIFLPEPPGSTFRPAMTPENMLELRKMMAQVAADNTEIQMQKTRVLLAEGLVEIKTEVSKEVLTRAGEAAAALTDQVVARRRPLVR